MRLSYLYTGVALWGWVLAASPALAAHWSENVGWRALAMGGIPLAVVDETTEYNLFNFQNPAGLAFLPRENRLDLGGYVFIPKDSDALMRTDLIAPGGEYQGIIMSLGDDVTLQISPEARYYPNTFQQEDYGNPPATISTMIIYRDNDAMSHTTWIEMIPFSYGSLVFQEKQRVHLLMDYQVAGAYRLLPNLSLGGKVNYQRPVQDVWVDYNALENLGGTFALGWKAFEEPEEILWAGLVVGINDTGESGRFSAGFSYFSSHSDISSGTSVTDTFKGDAKARAAGMSRRVEIQAVHESQNGLALAVSCEALQFRMEYDQDLTWTEEFRYESGTGDPAVDYSQTTIFGPVVYEQDEDTTRLSLCSDGAWRIPYETGKWILGLQLLWVREWTDTKFRLDDGLDISTISYDDGTTSTSVDTNELNPSQHLSSGSNFSGIIHAGCGYASDNRGVSAGLQVDLLGGTTRSFKPEILFSWGAGVEAWLEDWIVAHLGFRSADDRSDFFALDTNAYSVGIGFDFGGMTINTFGRTFFDFKGGYLYSEAFASTSVKW